ncbi:hypothetical protein GCM10027190_02500 [Spirosoma areae]
MVFYLNHRQWNTDDLLNWPPLRIYDRSEGAQWLPVSDLMYLESELNYTWLHWADGRRVFIPRTLKWFEDKLPPAWFLRLHRHCLVNRRYIERVEMTLTGRLYLHTGVVLPVSRRRWPRLRRQMDFRPPDRSECHPPQPTNR